MVIGTPGTPQAPDTDFTCDEAREFYIEYAKLRNVSSKVMAEYDRGGFFQNAWKEIVKWKIRDLKHNGAELLETTRTTKRLHCKQPEPPAYLATLGYTCTVWHLVGMECLKKTKKSQWFSYTLNFR